MQSETYLVDVCDEVGDKYRFGFNGQEKVNEMAGIGNHNTAEFWEYDTRVARRWNLDPVDQISISNYATFGNNPILNVDVKGDQKSSTHSDPPDEKSPSLLEHFIRGGIYFMQAIEQAFRPPWRDAPEDLLDLTERTVETITFVTAPYQVAKGTLKSKPGKTTISNPSYKHVTKFSQRLNLATKWKIATNYIDFDRPVFTKTIQKNKTLYQYRIPGTDKGSYFVESLDTKPEDVGLKSSDYTEIYKVTLKKAYNVLKSTH